jgi:hypothetical protein
MADVAINAANAVVTLWRYVMLLLLLKGIPDSRAAARQRRRTTLRLRACALVNIL